MKISNIAVSAALALAACGADDHDGVVWDATGSPHDSWPHIPGDALTLWKYGPSVECDGRLPLCDAAQVSLELPAGDFEVRFTGVRLTSTFGMIGAAVESTDRWISTYYASDAEDEWVGADSPSSSWEDSNDDGERRDAEFLLVRENDQVGVRGTAGTDEVTVTDRLGTGPVRLTLFTTAFQSAYDDTTKGEFGGRALSGDMYPFDADVIELE